MKIFTFLNATAFFALSAYSSITLADENKVCSSSPEKCSSGTILILSFNKYGDEDIAKYCDYEKTIVVGGTDYTCVKK